MADDSVKNFSPQGEDTNPILYRHYQGLSPSQIARELKITEEDVRDTVRAAWKREKLGDYSV